MCGIAGFLGPWSDRLLVAMLDAMAHRGPDGRGIWRDPNFGLALGHLRLSIIDLSQAANQPMHTADGRYTISFNGEIYNYRALRAELEAAGVVFRTQSDTEVLLHLVAREGEACLARLQGIFAFAVWDRATRRLFLARDHLGIKPLYYAKLPTGFLFASELKALTACPDLPRDIDPEAVLNHVGFIWSSSEATMLKAARKLRPGHCAWVEPDGRLTVRRYYSVPVPAAHREAVDPADLLSLFDQVVEDQMVADVPVGALLSGGVDSSAIVASMCRATDPKKITTFCASVKKETGRADNFGDDIVYAREMAAALKVNLIEVPTDADLIDRLPDMLWDLDEPTGDFAALQTRMVSAEARRNGLKVLLAGTGGDDLFTGYGRHTAAYIRALLGQVPGARRLVSALISKVPSNSLVGRRLARLGQLLTIDDESALIEMMSFSTWPPAERLALLEPDARAGLTKGQAASLHAVLDRTRGLHPVERLLQLDLDGFLPDLNLNYADKMAMKEGVELRVPIIDTRLVAFAMTVPTSQKISLGRTKRIFREAMRDRLTPGVLTRSKQGFGAPVRAWLAGPARALMDELTSQKVLARRGLFNPASVARLRAAFDAQQGDVAFTLLSVMSVELWCRGLEARPALAQVEARKAA